MSIDEGMKKARTACESAAASLKAATMRATEATGEFTRDTVDEEFSRVMGFVAEAMLSPPRGLDTVVAAYSSAGSGSEFFEANNITHRIKGLTGLPQVSVDAAAIEIEGLVQSILDTAFRRGASYMAAHLKEVEFASVVVTDYLREIEFVDKHNEVLTAVSELTRSRQDPRFHCSADDSG